MVDLVVRNMRAIVGPCRAVIVLREDMRTAASSVDLANDMELLYVPQLTQGAASTVEHALEFVRDDEEVIVANSDQIVEFDGHDFEESTIGTQGTILTFRCPERDPKWSYAALDADGYVERVAEKNPISEHATVGVYRFETAKLLRDAINYMRLADDRTNGEFYLCPSYNHMPVGSCVVTVNVWNMWGLGTPEDLERSLADTNFNDYVRRALISC